MSGADAQQFASERDSASSAIGANYMTISKLDPMANRTD